MPVNRKGREEVFFRLISLLNRCCDMREEFNDRCTMCTQKNCRTNSTEKYFMWNLIWGEQKGGETWHPRFNDWEVYGHDGNAVIKF